MAGSDAGEGCRRDVAPVHEVVLQVCGHEVGVLGLTRVTHGIQRHVSVMGVTRQSRGEKCPTSRGKHPTKRETETTETETETDRETEREKDSAPRVSKAVR